MKQQNNLAIAKILFVCSGNVCRSIMAETLLKEKVNSSKIEVKSAGISAVNGMPILPNTQAILETRGIKCISTSQAITLDLIKWSDLILTMTQSHKYFLLAKLPRIGEKVFTLKEYIGETEDLDVNIPQENLDSYYQCLLEIDKAIEQLFEKVRINQ